MGRGAWWCTRARASPARDPFRSIGVLIPSTLGRRPGGAHAHQSGHRGTLIDGRTARAVRTKDAIVDACLELIDGGDLRPTGPRIADRAGVSVRSIFQHFDDLDALFAAVGDRVTLRVSGLIGRIDPSSPLADRVDVFVAQRTEILEVLTPVLRAALVHVAPLHGDPPAVRRRAPLLRRGSTMSSPPSWRRRRSPAPCATPCRGGLVVALVGPPAWRPKADRLPRGPFGGRPARPVGAGGRRAPGTGASGAHTPGWRRLGAGRRPQPGPVPRRGRHRSTCCGRASGSGGGAAPGRAKLLVDSPGLHPSRWSVSQWMRGASMAPRGGLGRR